MTIGELIKDLKQYDKNYRVKIAMKPNDSGYEISSVYQGQYNEKYPRCNKEDKWEKIIWIDIYPTIPK